MRYAIGCSSRRAPTHAKNLAPLADCTTALCHIRHVRDRIVDERERSDLTGRVEPCERAIAIELEDFRGALDWGTANGEAILANEALAAVGRDWRTVALAGEEFERIANAIDLLADGTAASLRSALLTWKGTFAFDFGRVA